MLSKVKTTLNQIATLYSNDQLQKKRLEQFKTVQKESCELFEKKNKTYGDAFAEYGTIGVLVRMGDKIKRLQNITSTGINLIDDESLRDTLIDLHNYSAMAIMLLDEDSNKKNNEMLSSSLHPPSPIS